MNEQTLHIKSICADCGDVVEFDAPLRPAADGPFARRLNEIARAQASGEMPVFCPKHEEEDVRREDAERRASRLQSRYDHGGVPKRFQETEWEDFTDVEDGCKAALAEVRRFTIGQSQMPGVYLWGETGVGKTMMLGAAATAELRAGGRVRWIDVGKLLTDLRGGFNSVPYKRAYAKLEEARPGEVLILDDLDKAMPNDREAQPLYVAINDWVNAGNRILVSANRHMDHLAHDFGERFGAPIASRLIGVCTEIEVAGRDRRLDEVEVTV
jgi:DNA replication protein DnaC